VKRKRKEGKRRGKSPDGEEGKIHGGESWWSPPGDEVRRVEGGGEGKEGRGSFLRGRVSGNQKGWCRSREQRRTIPREEKGRKTRAYYGRGVETFQGAGRGEEGEKSIYC